MRIGLVGATGFIGAHVIRLLEARGHRVRVIGRDGAVLASRYSANERRLLPETDADTEGGWPAVVDGLDGIVWAAGTLAGPALPDVHERLPAAFAAAARAAGVRHAVYVSAIGVAADAPTAFLRTKAAGEAAWLDQRRPGWTVLRPSLVHGRGGASAGLFAMLASLPVRPHSGGGTVRPIAVEDVAAAIVACLESRHPLPPVIDAVGPDAVTADGYTDAIGDWLGIRPWATVAIPGGLLDLGGRLGAAVGVPLVGPDTLVMLRRGADGDPRALPAATGVHPAGLAAGLGRRPADEGDRAAAYLGWLLPLLRLSLIVLWIGTGIVSLTSYDLGMAMLAQGGITGAPATGLLVAGAVWDLLLGLALLVPRRTAVVAGLQIATVLAYTALATVLVPDAWVHPFGPLLKNLPILAATALLAALARR